MSQFVETSQHVFPNGRRKREIVYDKEARQYYEIENVEAQEVGNAELKPENSESDDDFDDENDFDDELNNENMIPKHSDYTKVTKEELMDMSGTRWLLYDGMGKMLTAKGFEGRYCVLRAICESAESKFGYHSGLFGQLFHIFFTPSSTDDVIINKDHYDYVKAEMLGNAGENCGEVFYQCKKSIMEIFTQVYDSRNLFKF